jgi:hypothetical protein
MPRYCPTGHGEFADWIARCPGCGEPLVDRDPTPPTSPTPALNLDEPIVYLATAANEPLADLWTDVLQEAGSAS